uniref:Cyclic GMP-AMP synthase n=1 Tax=Anas platyrhynchos platyrhynchos TaxID=8840 RepID=A0A493U3T7_ANAPP
RQAPRHSMAPPRHPAPGTQHGPGTGSGARRSRHVPRRPGAPQRPPARRLLREGGAAARPGPGASPSARRDFRFLGAAGKRNPRRAPGAAPPAAASRGRGRAAPRAAGAAAPPGQPREEGGGRGGSAESGGEAAVAVPPLRLRAVLSQLSLGRRDVSEASGLVNQVVSHLIQAIRGRDGGFGTVSRLGAGSYYERVKISEPNEFDIMLVMPIARIQLDECDDTGAYYYLTFKRNPKEKYLNRFLDEDGKLSADKMLTALRKIIKEEVKNIKDVEVTVKRRKARSPAITLLIKNSSAEISVDIILALEVQQSWPPSTQDGLNIERWLGRKVRRELRNKPIYLSRENQYRTSYLCFISSIRHAMSLPSNELNYTSSTQ